MEKIYSKQKNRKKKTSFLKISLLTDLSYLSHSPFLTFLERRKLATRRGREKRLEERPLDSTTVEWPAAQAGFSSMGEKIARERWTERADLSIGTDSR